MKTSILLCGTLVALALTGCGGGSTDDSSTTSPTPTPTPSSDGSQSLSDLANDYQICGIFDSTVGTTLNGQAYTLNMHLGSDGSYYWGLYFASGTTCPTVMNSSGQNIFTFHQSGTYTVNGTNTVPSAAATKVILTPTSQDFTIYGASSTGGAQTMAQSFATWMNANCTGLSSNFTAGDSGRSMNAVTCNWASNTYNIGDATANGTAVKNIFYYNGSYLLTGAGSGFLSFGSGSYPTTFGGYGLKQY